MAIAQGILKQTNIIKQSGIGVPGAGAGSQTLRRETSIFTLDTATYAADEIITHEQSTGVGYGIQSTKGTLTGLLSAGTYPLLFQSIVRKNFVSGVSTAALSLTIAIASSNWTVTRSTGSYLTDGFKIGDVVQLTVGAFNAANISKNLLVLAINSATVITVYPLNGVALVAEGPITSSTISVVNKKTLAPLTAQTNDYFTVEEWYADLTKSELFTDLKVSQIDLDIPATGNIKMTANFLGLARTRGTSQVLTTPTVETVTSVLAAAQADIYISTGTNTTTVADTVWASATSLKLTITGNMTQGDAVIGGGHPLDVNRGRIAVSGTFTAMFDGTTEQAFYDGQTPVSIIAALSADQTANSQFMCFSMGRVKITSDAPDDGEKNIMRTYAFTAEINSNGGSALAYDQTILSIQDSNA